MARTPEQYEQNAMQKKLEARPRGARAPFPRLERGERSGDSSQKEESSRAQAQEEWDTSLTKGGPESSVALIRRSFSPSNVHRVRKEGGAGRGRPVARERRDDQLATP